ncbi:MAG TPA: preprotein translocase subunit SecY [Verrucomicrobiae bacterium]|nr:preprotein translocase subunit SecY [Verrucomicrobiae bacterium]
MFRNLFNTFSNCFKIPELKSRILFTFGLLAVARLLAVIRIPGLNGDALTTFFSQQTGSGGLLGMYNTFAGGAFEHCAIGSLGIMPYISATIILQLLTAVWPTLSKLAREEGGRTKIIQYGRYLTVLLCIGQGFYFAKNWLHPASVFNGFQGRLVLIDNLPLYFFLAVTVMTAGTMLLMWLGEQITERGIGNGVSLIITVGILARMPQALKATKEMFWPSGGGEPTHSALGVGILLIVLLLVVVGGVIAITQAQRKIPVQYASRMVGQKMYQGGTNYMPLRVNYAGVMPIIFAQSILMFPQPILTWIASHTTVMHDPLIAVASTLNYGSWLYMLVYALMILFFSYFWVATQFNEIQIADDLKKNGGYIPGVRPGQGTSDYLHKAMSRITLAGAIFLTVIATIPIILSKQLNIDQNVSQFFGGTSILIAVGVLLDTMRQVESHLMMRNYDGFLKKGRIRGRF